jgi:hypothetical protein
MFTYTNEATRSEAANAARAEATRLTKQTGQVHTYAHKSDGRQPRYIVHPVFDKCACGNTARLGSTLCGRCAEEEDAEMGRREVWDALQRAICDIEDGPTQRAFEALTDVLRSLK